MTDQPCPSCGTYPPWHRIDCEAEPAPKDGSKIFIWASYGLDLQEGRWRDRDGRKAFLFVAGRDVDPTHWMPKPEGPREA